MFTIPHLRHWGGQSPVLSRMSQGVGVVQVTCRGRRWQGKALPWELPNPAEIKVKELICFSLTATCLGLLGAYPGSRYREVSG